MSARDEILARLRLALNDPALRYPPPSPVPLTAHMSVTEATGDAAALAARFAEELLRLHGSATLAASPQEALAALLAQLEQWQQGAGEAAPRALLAWQPEALPLPGVAEALAAQGWALRHPAMQAHSARAEAEPLRYGLTSAEAAFASTGSLLMVAAPGRSRAASLMPLHHIALVPWGRLFPTPEGWLAAQRGTGRLPGLLREAGNVTLVTGPSKSADIEMNLTLGVHGPQFLHAILYPDA